MTKVISNVKNTPENMRATLARMQRIARHPSKPLVLVKQTKNRIILLRT